MEQITIQVKDKKKAQTLVDFLKTLDFVDKVSSMNMPESSSGTNKGVKEFFALAGLWAERDITLNSIREKAWPYRT